jgi:uncharacterized RDD family membrane protein YckC
MIKNFDKTLGKISETVGFWRRALAFLIDIVIINIIIASPFRNILYKQFGNLSVAEAFNIGSTAVSSTLYWMMFILSVLALLYFTFFEYYLGQTPGNMLTKIRIISLKDGDKKVGLWRAAVRNCYVFPFFPFYIFWIIEPIYLAFYRERFLEKITFTRTVYESYDYGSRKIKTYKDYKLEKV